MSVNIEESADTAQNSIRLILCILVGLSTTHVKMILFHSNIHSFARNKFEIVNGIFLQQIKNLEIVNIRNVPEQA